MYAPPPQTRSRQPRRAKPDSGSAGGRRKGRERLYKNFKFMAEVGRLSERPNIINTWAQPNASIRASMQTFRRAFMVRQRLKEKRGEKPPTWIGTVSTAEEKRPRVYYVDRRGGKARRVPDTFKSTTWGKEYGGAPEGRTERDRIFIAQRRVPGAEFLGGDGDAFVHAERRNRRRGTRVFRGFNLNGLLDHLMRRRSRKDYVIERRRGFARSPVLPIVFVSSTAVPDAILWAKIRHKRSKKTIYVYSARRTHERPPPHP